MLLLGSAGLLLLHGTVDLPSRARAQQDDDLTPTPPSRPAQPPAGSVHYKDLIPSLLAALADSDGVVRQLAASTLVKIGPQAVGPLTEALNSKDREMRANAAYVLGQMGEHAPEALPALAKALKDEDKDVRRRAAHAIYHIVSRGEAIAASGPAGRAMGPVPVAMPIISGSTMSPAAMAAGPWDPGLLVPAAAPPAKGAAPTAKE
jgi:HEAT repeat protein